MEEPEAVVQEPKVPLKSFFALLAPVASQISRQVDVLAEPPSMYFFENNPAIVPAFLPNFVLSKFIHMINTTPGFINQGRITLLPETQTDYNSAKITFALKSLFNKSDCDSTVLFLQGHGTPDGAFHLLLKEGDVPLFYRDIRNLWDNRSSRDRNRLLFVIADFSFAGHWVLNNDSRDILIQSSCGFKEPARDFVINGEFIGSVFLHNLLAKNNYAGALFKTPEMAPMSTQIDPRFENELMELLGFTALKNGWDDFEGPDRKAFDKFNVLGV